MFLHNMNMFSVPYSMPSRIKQRVAANTPEAATQSVNERILKDIHALYMEPKKGLVSIAANLDYVLQAPTKKVVVMLIGNHSAGKSTFINWYIEEHVQKTGVAIETQGFTLVTSGKRRETLTGNATLHLYPRFKCLEEISGLVNYLITEICTSKEKKFSLVTFIDTPGLVDGDMLYPYDVDNAILWFGQVADLVLVFFDPIGQALCKRTLNLVEKLNEQHGDRLRFFLSKADEAGTESDRQKVMMQIVQELCKRPGLNKAGLDMPTIYIPHPDKFSKCGNQIDEICKEIEKTINQTVQNSLNNLEKDCDMLSKRFTNKLKDDAQVSSDNFRSNWRGYLCAFFGILIPVMFVLNLMVSSFSDELLASIIGKRLTDIILMYLSPMRQYWKFLPASYHFHGFLFLLALCAACLICAKLWIQHKETLTRKQKRALLDQQAYVQNVVKLKKQDFYEEYLRQCVADHDL